MELYKGAAISQLWSRPAQQSKDGFDEISSSRRVFDVFIKYLKFDDNGYDDDV